jgi:eukaryotic-like serine/threonine-protein kinase
VKVIRDLVGEVFSGRYRIISRLAGGGMGEVYRGHDLLLDRPVAVKVLEQSLASDPQLVERFKEEARAAARLTDPRVVAVYDWGAEDDSTYFMVMEYVSGIDLRDLLVTCGSLAPAQAIEIVSCVCDALTSAHARGLVHRDIKPENILVARNGDVKVADFGIAVIAGNDLSNPSGAIPGTLRYLSPEQAAGHPATEASDLWGAGAVLYETLTGVPPLMGAGPELLRRRATEPPRLPSEQDSRIPAELDDVVARACAIHPEDRFGSASEMSEALRSARRAVDDAPPVGSLLDDATGEVLLPDIDPTSFLTGPRRERRMRRRRRLRLATLAVLLVALLAGGLQAAPYLFGPRAVDVPDLVGMSSSEATDAARSAGLDVVVVSRFSRIHVPRGEVLAQFPPTGTLEEGSLVELVVSSGPPMRNVPEVTGMPLSPARVRLRAAGLRVGNVVERHDQAPEGEVIAQRPRRGELSWGSRVRLVVSRGPQPVAIPEVAGMRLNRAVSALEEAGFETSVVETFSDDVNAGRVIGTDPPAAATAPEGSEIRVVVSLGPEFKELEMPDVRNMNVGRARNRLEGLGLRVRVVQSCGGGGTTVIETDPVAGASVRENDRVALFVC